MNNITTHDVFALYFLLKNYLINWAKWFKAYILERFEDMNVSASLPYCLLISSIIVDRLVDLSLFTPSLINANYDSHTFSSMGYVNLGEKWVKKDSVRILPKPSKILVDSAALSI